MKRVLSTLVLLAVCSSFSVMATETSQTDAAKPKSAIREQLDNHFKFYGFIRNYFTYDSRESISGTGELFYYLPKDRNIGAGGEDLNLQSSFKALALTSRLGVDVSGYCIKGMSIGAKVETDFYNGLTGVSGTAVLRLRQAYLTLGWKELGEKGRGSIAVKAGQAWHPMAADMPDIFSLATGAPFGPFSRTPLVMADFNLTDKFSLTASTIWQMQYLSAGPDGASANYQKYSCTPEFYFGLNYKSGAFLGRAGIDVLSIKPRNKAGDVKVSDRITTKSFFLFLQYKKDKLAIKAKTVLAEAGEHVCLNGGYGVSAINPDGSWSYTPSRNSSTWFNLTYGKKVQGILFAGYVKNFGTKDPIVSADKYYFSKNSFANVNQMFRITPSVIYNIGKFSLGLEYEITTVQYGDSAKMNLKNALCDQDLHWITNNRVQALVKFTF